MGTLWNLSQTFAWIRWRDVRKVQKYTTESSAGVSGEFFYLCPLGENPEKVIEPQHATKLLIALQAGEIAAVGCKNGRGDIVSIEPMQWAVLQLFDPSVARPLSHHRHGTFWTCLRFEARAVRAKWSADGSENSPVLTPKQEVHRQLMSYLNEHKPEPTHGWRTEARKAIKVDRLGTSAKAKYTKDDLDKYESNYWPCDAS